mgnify:CR=1 FL=1
MPSSVPRSLDLPEQNGAIGEKENLARIESPAYFVVTDICV